MNDSKGLTLLGQALILILCTATLATSGYSAIMTQASAAGIEPPAKTEYALTPLPSYITAIEKVMPSVVFIYTEKTRLSGNKPVFEGGSGIILRSDGYILTNRHVVEDVKNVWVTLNDMSTFEAAAVYPGMLMDLAVVKINAGGLPTATIGDSDKLRVGDHVIAVGNPLGLSPADGISAATAGIVSKRDCSFVMQGVPYYDMIQTDAAINTGNSGGPLVNLDGEVIGINSAHALFAQNVGFAISMNTAKHVFDDLATLGKSNHPYLGITAEDMQPRLTGSTTSTQRRAIITRVEQGSPAAAAGFNANDVILRISEREVHTVSELNRLLWRMSAGDVVQITCQRGQGIVVLTVKLAIRPDGEPLAEL
jgi:serine protease Do